VRGLDCNNKVNGVQEIIEGLRVIKKIKNIYGGLNILR
jgi:acid stress-induced BolA-like protein IbaG/YrbA